MHIFTRILLLVSTLFIQRSVTLPYGCGGKLGVANVTEGGFHGRVWTCAKIDPTTLHASSQNFLYAAATKENVTDCGNFCSGFYNNGTNAGVFYPNSTCACWGFGDINTSPSAATQTSNATFIDFYETGNTYGPSAAQYWGKFKCPEGAYHNTVYQQGVPYGACYPLSIQPGQKPLAECPSPKAQWEIWQTINGFNKVTCYAKLAGVQVGLNFSSATPPKSLIDIYDFTSHSSTTTHKATATTKKSSSRETGAAP